MDAPSNCKERVLSLLKSRRKGLTDRQMAFELNRPWGSVRRARLTLSDDGKVKAKGRLNSGWGATVWVLA